MTHNVHIRLANERVDNAIFGNRNNKEELPRLYTPGEILTCASGYMGGHGTYPDDDAHVASVAGVVQQVNKLISVQPIKNRYDGAIGDVVVGRITEVQQKRWKVDTNSRLDSVLMLTAVNLLGGELRKRSVEDEHMMRKYLQEGDLISAEVQKKGHDDGSLLLYTRSSKYGKLSQGILVKVLPSLVKRRKIHFHNLSCGASIILGNNGYIWISPTSNSGGDDNMGGFSQNLEEPVPRVDREVIARLRNCILALASCRMMLYDTSIEFAYEESKKYEVSELLQPGPIRDICDLTQQRLEEAGS